MDETSGIFDDPFDRLDPAALDLNLLRVFAAVHRCRSVSRAAEQLGMSQPAASSAIARLRRELRDPLFARAHHGVRPTPVADQLARAVSQAFGLLADALGDSLRFDPARSRRRFRLHLSDIGEARFLPALMAELGQRAPGVTLDCRVAEAERIPGLLDSGELDFAFGYLSAVQASGATPATRSTRAWPLIEDHYTLLLRQGHPQLGALAAAQGDPNPADPGSALQAALGGLGYAVVRSHSETLAILHSLDLADRVRLSASHFLALPAIVRRSDLGVVMPAELANEWVRGGDFTRIDLPGHWPSFVVSLHASRLRQPDAAQAWLAEVVRGLFGGGTTGP